MGMKPNWLSCFLVIILLASCIEEGSSIKCWVCRSDIDPSCADPFDNTTNLVVDCNHQPQLDHLPGVNATLCRKIRQKVNGESKIIRTCAYLDDSHIAGNETHSCWTRSSKHKILIEYCTCNTDGCNAGPTVYSNNFLIIFSAFLAACCINRF